MTSARVFASTTARNRDSGANRIVRDPECERKTVGQDVAPAFVGIEERTLGCLGERQVEPIVQ
jgi:hypothetical protein